VTLCSLYNDDMPFTKEGSIKFCNNSIKSRVRVVGCVAHVDLVIL